MILTQNEVASVNLGTEATPGLLAKRLLNNHRDYTIIEWFAQQGARFVRVAAWNAEVILPGKQPIDQAWPSKHLTAEEVLPHVSAGGNIGILCGKPSGGLCMLDIDDQLQEFLEYCPELAGGPIIQRGDAPNRGKLLIRIPDQIPANRKWSNVNLEFLGTGNQGVIPPSIHPEGAIYELLSADRPLPELEGSELVSICQSWSEHRSTIPAEVHSANMLPIGRHGILSRKTRDFIELGSDVGTRNDRLFKAASDLNGCGYSLADAEGLLLNRCLSIGLSEKEILTTIASAYSQARIPANPRAYEMTKRDIEASIVSENFIQEEADHTPQGFLLDGRMPELPRVAQLSDAEVRQGKKAGKFIDEYMAFAMKDAPMSPPLFHQTYGLAILSTAIARRLFVRVGTGSIYPNLYIILAAPSTLYTKTTGYRSAMKLIEVAGLSHLLLPDGVTPQSLITELSNRPQENYKDWSRDDQEEWQKERLFAGQRSWWIDESSRLLIQFQQKHLAELLPILLRLYESEPKIKVSTQIRGRETVRWAYLTICGPTTPAALRPYLKMPDYWTNGLFARFLLVSPDTAPVRVFYPEPFPVPTTLAKHINRLTFERLEQPKENNLGAGSFSAPPSIEAKISPEVWKRWDHYHNGMYEIINKKKVPEKLGACYGRFHEKAIKIAMLLAASDWTRSVKENTLEIQPAHWFRAQEITESYRASLHRIIEEASRPMETEDDELVEKIIHRLRTSARNSRRELATDLHMQAGSKRTDFDMVLSQLIKDGVVIEKEVKKERGPSTGRLFVKNP